MYVREFTGGCGGDLVLKTDFPPKSANRLLTTGLG
jgi:hypothetical protein